MCEFGGDEPFESGHELVDALGRQIELEEFDRDEMFAFGIVRSKERS